CRNTRSSFTLAAPALKCTFRRYWPTPGVQHHLFRTPATVVFDVPTQRRKERRDAHRRSAIVAEGSVLRPVRTYDPMHLSVQKLLAFGFLACTGSLVPKRHADVGGDQIGHRHRLRELPVEMAGRTIAAAPRTG